METQRNGKPCASMDRKHPLPHWDSIDWDRCEKEVRKLQMRTAKAQREGKKGRVKALQRILTRSLAAKLLAVRRVTTNRGKNTPGVDKETWKTPEKKIVAVLDLKRKAYRPLPLRRIYIPKKNGKLRPLGIPTMHDRAMQAVHLLALIPISEQTADPNSYGFRPYRSTADAIEQCFRVLSRKTSAQWILEADIAGCFDQISHDWLLSHAPMDREVLRKWLKAGYIDQGKLYPTQRGTPQGGIVSPTAANLTLDGLEKELKKFPRSQKVHFVRFADDFIVTGSSKEFLEREVRPVVEQFLGERGLELSQEKTKVAHIGEGFDFLGANVRKYGAKLLIKPAVKNVKAFLGKIRDTLNGAKAATQNQVIEMLNPVIVGWSNFHRHSVAKSTFARVDHEIHTMLWNWASRRHSNKGKGWIKARYFPRRGSQDWAFTDPLEKKGPVLARASDTPIKRHDKIKMDANPFDPKWTTYFEERKSRLKTNSER